MQGAVEEANGGGIVAVCIDITEGRSAIDIAINERETFPRSSRGRANIDNDITRSDRRHTVAAAKDVAIQGAVEEADSSGIVAVCIDTTKGRSTIDIAIDERKACPRSDRGRANIDKDITRSAGGLSEAAAKHFSDMSGIFTYLAT